MEREPLAKAGLLALIITSLGSAVYYSQPLPPTGKTVIRFLTYETGVGQMALVNKIKDSFEKENPDVEVQVEFNSTSRDKIYVEAASHTAPETFYCVTDDIPRLAMKGAIEPLNKWIAADKTSNLSVYFPEVVRALRFAPAYKHIPVDQRELYAYPIHFSTDVLFYNKDMFKAAHVPYPTDNWTWAQMVDAAKKLTIRDSEGHVTQFGLFLPEADATIQSNGGSVFNSDYSKCIIASPQALEAMIELRDLRYKYGVSPTPAQVQDSSSMQMFKLGELAMLPGRTYMTVDFNKITAFGYDVARMPGMKKPLARLAVGGICMSRDVDQKHKEAAFRWMKYYCSPNGGQRFFGSEKNCVTAVKAYAYSPDFFLKPPPANSKILVDSLKNSQITVPPILGASEYLNKIYTPQRDDMLRYPDGDLMKALRQFQSDTNALLQKEPKG